MKRTKFPEKRIQLSESLAKQIVDTLIASKIGNLGTRTRVVHVLLRKTYTSDTCVNISCQTTRNKEQKSFQLDPLITPSMFETFWRIYPRKIDKSLAKDRWNKICKAGNARPTWRVVKTAIQEQSQSERWIKQLEYIPYPTTWLNKARWNDNVKEMKPYDIRQDNTPPVKIQDGIKYYYGKDNQYWTKSGRLYIE